MACVPFLDPACVICGLSLSLVLYIAQRGFSPGTPGGAVASWLVRSSPDRAVRVRVLARDIVLCSWAASLHQLHDWEQCGLCSIPGPGVICGLSLSLLLYSAQRGFSPGTPVFPSS